MIWLWLFLLGCGLLLFKKWEVEDKWFLGLLITWLGYISLSVFYLNESVDPLWASLAVTPVYYIALLREDKKALWWHTVFIGISLTVLGISTCYQSFSESYVHWPLINSNNLAAILNVGVIGSIILVKENKKWVLLTLLFLFALYATGSKGGIMSCIICLCLLLNRKWFIPLIAAGLFVLYINWPLETLIIRFERWEVVYEMIKGHWLTGIGLGNFHHTFPLYVQAFYPEYGYQIKEQVFFVHNDPLQFAVEMGIFSTILFYTLCLYGIRYIKNIVPFCILLAVVLHTHFSFHLYLPSVGILLGLTLSHLTGVNHALKKH